MTDDTVPASEDPRSGCGWEYGDPLLIDHHDREWGVPCHDDRALFEQLMLEGFQAGLSWLTILRKREGFRAAFAGFDIPRVARFTERDVARLLGDAAIVRHRGKIEATSTNARAAAEVQDAHGSLAALFWSFEPRRRAAPRALDDLTSTTPESTALSKALKGYGFGFVGPTTVYAAMQAMGVVNDHMVGCAARGPCTRARRALVLA